MFNQGKIVVERGEKEGYFIMFPNGDVAWQSNKKSAEARAKLWFKENLKSDIGIGEIEWRNV